MTDLIVRHGWHWTFGWLRRPDMDQDNMYCYEQPDGGLVYSKRREHKHQMYLDCRRDDDAEEDYLCISPVPRRTSHNKRTVK